MRISIKALQDMNIRVEFERDSKDKINHIALFLSVPRAKHDYIKLLMDTFDLEERDATLILDEIHIAHIRRAS